MRGVMRPLECLTVVILDGLLANTRIRAALHNAG